MISILSKPATWFPDRPPGGAFWRVFSSRTRSAQLIWTAVTRSLVYQEILYDVKPDVIIEAGTYKGGSALYLASIFDLIGKGRVITIDIAKRENRPVHDRVTYLLGSSTSDEIVREVESLLRPTDKIMVVLDSDQSAKHVLEELRIYDKYVIPGSFLIVEDGNMNGNPILPYSGPGPGEALGQFLKENSDFEVDKSKEKFLMTFNPNGYLRRVN